MTDTLPQISQPQPDEAAERLLTTQSPQRRLAAPSFSIEIDGRTLTGREGQTILEVCRDNGIEVPTLCYEPKLPGFGACRMCVVEVDGEETPPISCSREAQADMVVRTQTPALRQVRKTNLELIFSDHNAYCLPPCTASRPARTSAPATSTSQAS
jgi:formate dehydrogenase major subunit